MIDCNNCKPMLSGLLDKELSPEETALVNDHLIRCAGCRKEYEELVKTNSYLGSISLREPEDIILDKLWNKPFSRFTHLTGIFLVIFGYLLFIGYSIYQLLHDPKEALLVKFAVCTIITGLIILFPCYPEMVQQNGIKASNSHFH